ncbi:hypothetical protein BVC80_8611g20 [Macleaya cordata]|uniref:Uncharacterized protein n=1 Tax=Macleaya cordata TaxID=56857 RepID=A0A200QK43_MACCD|nr:hypothetical protein BVC80_8611g20 [Macleaya cordata]
MEKLCKELDDMKDEMEKLKAEYRIKADLSESLRRAHNEQLVKIKEAKLEIEKQAQEINSKAEEISVTKQMYEDVKNSLNEKESVLRHLRSANDKLRADYGKKLQKLEGENRDLSVALDESNMKSEEQEQKILAYKEEIVGLKGLLSASQKKCSEAEQRALASKELRQREDMLIKLEEENGKFKDQLKWKKEQFKHLEEAHDKMQDEFRLSKKEWEKEKSTLIDEISSLQTSLDSQTRIAESLQCRLQMCNQALAHEESRRKLLEVEISESKTCYENVFADYQEAKSKIDSLTARRDEEIASLRNSLGTKQTLFKEMEFRVGHLEQENQELKGSLKELREAQIQDAGAASSLSKLRNKLRGLEQVHKECSMNLKARETEWSSQMEKLMADLNECRSELDCKDKQILDLQMELEHCHSSILQLKLDYEEMSVLLMVFKSGFSDAQSDLSNSKAETGLHNKETDEQIAHLMEQLEQKNRSLVKAYDEIEKGRETTPSLMRKIESLDDIEQQYFLMQKELERYKEMLEESSGRYLQLKEQASQMENALKEELRKVSYALDIANSELAERTSEESEIDFELARRRSLAERLKASLEENQETRREMEASLLAQVETELTLKQENESLIRNAEEKDKIVDDLQKQIVLLEQELARREMETSALARVGSPNDFQQEKESFIQTIEEKKKSICNLQQQIASMEQEFLTREFEAAILAQTKEERTLEQEKERFHLVFREQNQIIDDLSHQIMLHRKSWDKITTMEAVGELEIQVKSLIIAELEEEINSLQQKLELQEKSLFCSKQNEEHLGAALEAKQLEIDQLGNQGRTSKGIIEKLESEKKLLLDQIMKLSSERRDLLDHIEEFSDQFSEFSDKDTELMGRLESIVHSIDKENTLVTDLMGDDDEFYDLNRENVNTVLSSSGKKIEANLAGRSPLKERNISC